MPNDLGSLLREASDAAVDAPDIDYIALTARHRTRRSRIVRATTALAGIVVVVASIAQLAADTSNEPAIRPTATTTAPDDQTGQGFDLLAPFGFEDTIVLGAPVGYEETGSLVAIDMRAGIAHQRMGTVPLWPGDAAHPLVVVDGRVVWAANGNVWATSIDLQDDPTVIGSASFLVPSATSGQVWIINQNPMRATEINAAGDVVQRERDLPEHGWPHAAVNGGLLVSTPQGLVIWDPTDGQARRVYDDRAVLAAAGDYAYLGAGLQLEMSTGETAFLGVAPGSNETAAFSPDGRHLAVFTWTPIRGRELVNVFTNHGSEPRVYDLTDNIRTSRLAWSADSRSLYLIASSRDDGSAERIIGVPLDGSAETIATINQLGWRWLASS